MFQNYKLCLVLFLLVLSGCTAKGPMYKALNPAEGKSIIYFYREYYFAGAPIPVLINVNGPLVAKLNNEGYYPYVTKPGLKKVFATFGEYSLNLEFEAKPNAVYYISAGGESTKSVATTGIALKVVPEAEALYEIRNNRLQVPKWKKR